MKESFLRRTSSHLRSIFDTESTGRLFWLSPIVGIVSGLGAALFFYGLEWFQELIFGQVMGYHPPASGVGHLAEASLAHDPTNRWAVLLVPAIGGLVTGFLVYTFAPEAEGHGTDAMVRSFHRAGGKIRGRVPIIKSLASIITIGTGGSAGREGPIAQVGAGFGSFLADRLGLSDRDRRFLMLSGAAGGIGAIFRAPLGGALFVCEVLYSSTALEFTAVTPALISSITAFAVFTTIHGNKLELVIPRNVVFTGLVELPFYIAFALLCSLVGFLYVFTFYGLRNMFRKFKIPNVVKPAIGGLLLGGLLLYQHQLMAGGYGWIQLAIDDVDKFTVLTLAVLCFGKILATSLTISSGGSGGVFAPSLFIGAMLGGVFGKLCNQFFPTFVPNPETFVLVGMGGFFAGVARVPLTAMLMVCEMSGSYDLLIPLMTVCIINVAILSSRWTLYEEQVPALVDSPAHQGDFVVDVLEQIRVEQVLDTTRKVDLVPQGMPLGEILRMAAMSRNTYFPVVNDSQRMVGIFSLRDLRAVLTGDGAGSLVVAIDVASSPVLTVSPKDDLHTALRRFTQKNIDDIPVVEPDDPGRVVGMLSRRDVIAAYHDRVTLLRKTE